MFMYANIYKCTKYEWWGSATHVALSCTAQERELCMQLHILYWDGKMCMGCAQNLFLRAHGRTICTTHAHMTDFGKNRYTKCANVYTCVQICFLPSRYRIFSCLTLFVHSPWSGARLVVQAASQTKDTWSSVIVGNGVCGTGSSK